MQSTSKVLMIRPVAFEFNEQTAVNNFYQTKPSDGGASETQAKAAAEFDFMVKSLMTAGVQVHVLHDTPEPHTPDSIFPNNWVSMHHNGTVALYPMYAENRRQERRMDLLPFLTQQGFGVNRVQLYTDHEQNQRFLEGTGSLVLDHEHRLAYASLSARTHPDLVKQWCQDFGYEPVLFEAHQNTALGKKDVYHTNVVLSVGKDFALVGTDNIGQGKTALLEKLESSGKRVIALSEEQINQFAANALELQTETGQRLFLLSERAWLSMEKNDKKWLEERMRVLCPPLYTIEDLGGGSARCMVAEIFLPLNTAMA